MPERFKAMEALYECGALRNGHFKLSSGLHSDTYVQCSRLLKDPKLALSAGKAIADAVDFPVDAVVSPAMGAVLIGFTTAAALGCEFVFSERVEGSMALRRGFDVEPGSNVLLVEDVITTGGSILETAELVRSRGAEVAGFACIVQRSDLDTGGPGVISLARVSAAVWEPDLCPLCSRGVALESPGSRHNG